MVNTTLVNFQKLKLYCANITGLHEIKETSATMKALCLVPPTNKFYIDTSSDGYYSYQPYF